MNILFVGDVVGKIGRKALKENFSFIKEKYSIDFTIVNGENITNGRGINNAHYNFLINQGVDCITLGNHYVDKKDELTMFIENDNIIRPINIKNESIKGEGTKLFELDGIRIRVSNVLGKVFMKEDVIPPYEAISKLLENDDSDIHIIDLHAEANGEKQSLVQAFKGEVSAIIGTHTHVQTRDYRIIDGLTAFISDVGMCGDNTGVIGYDSESVIDKQLLGKNRIMLLKDDAPYVFSAVVLSFDDYSFKPTKIIPIYIEKGE